MWPSTWSLPSWTTTANLQKRLFKYLIKRTVGQFLQPTELDDENLDIQLSSGHLSLKNLELSQEALNDTLTNLPISIVSGTIGKVSVRVPPWTQLWTGQCEMEIEELVIKTKAMVDAEDIEEAALTEDVGSILTSSVFIADDFLKTEQSNLEVVPETNGLRVVSEMVDRILSAVNIRIRNISVECEFGENTCVQLNVDSVGLLEDIRETTTTTTTPPAGISDTTEYRVVQFRTLKKKLEIEGLRISLGDTPVLTTFKKPVTTHLRIHRRMPFSELAPVEHGRGDDGLAYMGSMPGEFRQAREETTMSITDHPRNDLGEDARTSGWDVSVDIADIACVFTKGQLETVMEMMKAVAPLAKLTSERHGIREQFMEQLNRSDPSVGKDMEELSLQLARWVNIECKHIYLAVLPAECTKLLADWHQSSLAVLRLKLESTKHLALYLTGIGAKWESTPPPPPSPSMGGLSSTRSEPNMTNTETWAAQAAANSRLDKNSKVSLAAHLESFSFYDSDPEQCPVVQPLVVIDKKLASTDSLLQQYTANETSSEYEVWLNASGTDPVLVVNTGPIMMGLDKDKIDRLSAYQDMIGFSSLSASAVAGEPRGVADSIEEMMRDLRIDGEGLPAIPASIALCSPLIRTWVSLPSTATSAWNAKEKPAPGHFCIDAVDAVITNVVNGTATSSQSQDSVPDGHLRLPRIQELLESRKSVGGSGCRVECEALHVYVQAMEASSTIDHVATVKGGSGTRPHIEITSVATSTAAGTDYQRPPAFDAFSDVHDNIRVRMAPETELTTSLEYERQSVAQSKVVVSCHLPEAEVVLCRKTYLRLNAVVNEFMLWQSVQEEPEVKDGSAVTIVSVLVDIPRVMATINTNDTLSTYMAMTDSITIPKGNKQAVEDEMSQRMQLSNTQMFMSNALVEKGRTYLSVESNQVRLSSFRGEQEVDTALSHSYATAEEPLLTPQLSLYMLASPTISQETEIVLKTTWTTLDYHSRSTCLQDLEAFFNSAGVSGMVQPPPKPMRLSLNIQNSSFRWQPSSDPHIGSAVISLDSLAVIVGVNSPAPDRDREELRYYIEGLSVFGKSQGEQEAKADIPSDAWVSTGKFWKDHGYSVLVNMDMMDIGSKSRDGEEGGPLVDLKLYSESLVVDMCADSVGSLPLVLQDIVRDIGAADQEQKYSTNSPRIIGRGKDDVFEEVDENVFGRTSIPLSSTSMPGELVMDDYFVAGQPPDVADEYEVVDNGAGGQPLSPISIAHPTYSRRMQTARRESIEEEETFEITNYVESDDEGMFSEDEDDDEEEDGGFDPYSVLANRRLGGQRFAADGSVLLEPDRGSAKVMAPRAKIIDIPSSAGNHPVTVTVPPTDDTDSGEGLIEDYFKVPEPGDPSTSSSVSSDSGGERIICLSVDVARVEINLYSGQDWYVSKEPPLVSAANFISSYMDDLDGGDSEEQTSASMPESSQRQNGRSIKPQVELRATHLHAEYRKYSDTSSTAYDLGVNVDLLEILDQIETSEWSKFLTRRRDTKSGLPVTLQSLASTDIRNRRILYSTEDRVTGDFMRRQRSNRWPEGNAEPMMGVQMEAVRPHEGGGEEIRMDVEVNPLRCYIHQDALDFVLAFFKRAEQHSAGLGQKPIRTGGGWKGAARPYFQIVRVAPINLIFDYKPRRQTSGKQSVELVNFFPLEDAEMTLSSVKVRGVPGIPRLVRELGRHWLPHLTGTQLPGVVSGMTPLRSLVNLGSGMADLVILPLEQYRRDGRLVQGIRRGAKAFARTTARETVQLGAKMAVNAQTLLEQAGDILNVDNSSVVIDPNDWPQDLLAAEPVGFGKSKYARQPENLSEGMKQAYKSLKGNVGEAMQTVLAIPVVVQENASEDGRSQTHGSVRAVVRAVPVAVLKPMIGATEAVSKTLLGLRNTMEPGRKQGLVDKYKSRSLGDKPSGSSPTS